MFTFGSLDVFWGASLHSNSCAKKHVSFSDTEAEYLDDTLAASDSDCSSVQSSASRTQEELNTLMVPKNVIQRRKSYRKTCNKKQ